MGERAGRRAFICSVCSLQQPSLEHYRGLFFIIIIDFIYDTTGFRLCEAIGLILRDCFFLFSSKSPQVELIFVPAADFYVVLCDLVRRQKNNKKKKLIY